MHEGDRDEKDFPKCREGTCYHSKGRTSIAHGRYTVDGCPERLLTPERLELIEVWNRWKRFGSPIEGGWAGWPARLVDLLEALDVEHQTLERIELQWRRDNPDTPSAR